MMDDIIREDINKIKNQVKSEFFEEKKVLVTGGAGFIGSWLCDTLVDLNAQVIVIDDFSTGRMKNINHLIQNPKFKLIKSDVCKFKDKEKFDIILHIAGHASPDEYQVHPIETLQTSAIGTRNMAELARKNDATLLFASTSEVYGDAEVVPTPETYWGKVNSVGSRSCYDEGKRFAEALLIAYGKQYGLNIRIPRIFNTYGPRLREDGMYGRALSRFISQALASQPITVYGDGRQTRSFCYISDLTTALMRLTISLKAKGEAVNIGNIEEVTILRLADRVKEMTKTKSFIKFSSLPKDDPKRRCPDITKLENLIGWKPIVSFEEGLMRTIMWFSQRA
jgi:UDP-glucuronate decarboxylase